MFAKPSAFLNKKIQAPELKHQYHVHIEQYRGLCALLVLMEHGLGHASILKYNFAWPAYVNYIGAGHLSVIIFFCISGYVIGISNVHKKLDVKLYLKRRAVRLYPAYILSLVICVIVAGGVTLLTLTQNLLFLENINPYWHIKIPLFVNFATWSLNYEVLYYLLFIGLFFMRPKVWQLLLCMFFVSVLMMHCSHGILFLADYVDGFYFWLLGLFIGWKILGGNENKSLGVPLLSMLFLHMCFHHLGIGLMIIKVLGITTDTNFDWLFELPFCLMIMSILTQIDSLFLRINKIICYILPLFVFLFLLIHHRILENERWIMCLIYWVLSFVFYNEKRISALILEKLTVVGKISYALYLFHVPVAELIRKTVFINNPAIEIAVKYALWLTITFSLAYLADIVFQPVIKKFFFRPKEAIA